MKMKTCPKCGIEKSLDEFYKRKSRSRGVHKVRNPNQRMSHCIECCKAKYVKRVSRPKGPIIEKVCCRCKYLKSLSEFYKDCKSRDGYASFCKQCDRDRPLRKPNKAVARVSQRRGHYRRKYDMDIEDYDKLFETQDGCCAICGTIHPSRKKDVTHFSVDHDHSTGEVRGLLCDQYNLGLGHFQDTSEFLQKAINYLQREVQREVQQ